MVSQDPMQYDALLELATRICGQYLEWADSSLTAEASEHWNQLCDEVGRQIRDVDSQDSSQVAARRDEFRALWEKMTTGVPLFAE